MKQSRRQLIHDIVKYYENMSKTSEEVVTIQNKDGNKKTLCKKHGNYIFVTTDQKQVVGVFQQASFYYYSIISSS